MIIKFRTNINELAAADQIPYVETAVRSRIWQAFQEMLSSVHVNGVTGDVTVAISEQKMAAEIVTAVAQALYITAGEVEVDNV